VSAGEGKAAIRDRPTSKLESREMNELTRWLRRRLDALEIIGAELERLRVLKEHELGGRVAQELDSNSHRRVRRFWSACWRHWLIRGAQRPQSPSPQQWHRLHLPSSVFCTD
jgi:hypothetical protein